MLMLTRADFSDRLKINDAVPVCDQFWLDARAEGITSDQREDSYIHLTASGYLTIPLVDAASARMYWSATIDGDSGILQVAPCDQNPGVYLYGSVCILPPLDHGFDRQCEATFSTLLECQKVGDRIRTAIRNRVHAGAVEPLQSLLGMKA